MTVTAEWNFAGRLVKRIGASSYLIDAATGETVLPSDLGRLIANWGFAFLSSGLRRCDRVLIGCALSPPSSLAYLGAMYAGLVPVPVEDRTLRSSGDVFLRETGARAVWTEKSLRSHGTREGPVLYLWGNLGAKTTESMPPAACAKEDLAALVATSGSTGGPRFVMVSHGNLIANTETIIPSQDLGDDERAMLILPLSYCFGASVLHTHLYQGGGVVFDKRFMFPDKVLRAIGMFGCTTFAGVPTVYRILLRRSNVRSIPMPGLRRFLQAGVPLDPQSIEEMRIVVPTAKFYVMYGQTEATARISCLDPDRLSEKLGSVGRPLDNLAVRIVDEQGRDLSVGRTGEITVKGPSISRGYLNDAEETRRLFKDGWLRTRDLGHVDEDGYIWIDGRKGEFLKMRGMRVGFAEVEAKVSAVPGVYECAATAVAHPEAGEALALFVVPDNGAQHVIEEVGRSLPAHWTCDSINLVSELPRTPIGKTSRTLLQAKSRTSMEGLRQKIERLLSVAPYRQHPEERLSILLTLLQDELEYACGENPRFRNYVNHWPLDFRSARRIADLPYLPVGMLKADPPLSLIGTREVKRTLMSSATTGQTPSRIVLDSLTARRMTKGTIAIAQDFIGPARRPYLVVDVPGSAGGGPELGARAAAIRGLQPFAKEVTYCLSLNKKRELELDRGKLLNFAKERRESSVLVYGFTYILWNYLVEPLMAVGMSLDMPNVQILHSGGWKRLEDQAVDKKAFNEGLAQVFGCSSDRVIDFYGMVENVGIIYPDCPAGNKHVPAFGDVIVRDPLTLEPVSEGEQGIVQVCSVLPTSFPGYLLLTEDVAEVIGYDGCPCGRRGMFFRFVCRVPKVETRGCGNISSGR
jgi:acyl-CoA synthetase (AMP-forming)/AMP-acid ligase II